MITGARRSSGRYARSMRRRVGKDGEVMIPKALLRAVGLRPGDEVRFSVAGNAIRVENAWAADALMGRLSGHRLVEALQGDRRADRGERP